MQEAEKKRTDSERFSAAIEEYFLERLQFSFFSPQEVRSYSVYENFGSLKEIQVEQLKLEGVKRELIAILHACSEKMRRLRELMV